MFIGPGELVEHEAPPRLLAGAVPMAALIGLSAPFEGRQIPIRTDRTLIGSRRNYDNDIVLSDPTVSFMHARIFLKDGEWRVMNLLSTNGTFVNGERVRDAVIRHGDRLHFGRAEFVFQNVGRVPLAGTAKRGRGIIPGHWRWAGIVLLAAATGVGAWLLR